MARESVGELEHLILLVILSLGDNAYGASIFDRLVTHSSRTVLRPAVYNALRRLEAKGLVSSVMGEPTPERGGRAKRFFRVEPVAIEVLQESRRTLISLWDGVGATLDQA
jgi:DNA-binding PadR family transcriptional regulator